MEELLKQLVQEVKNINTRLDSMDKRFDSMDKRFDGIDARLGGVEHKLDKNTDVLLELDKKVSKANADIFAIKDQLDNLDAANASKHIEILDKIDALSKSVDFLKYEDLKTKEEVFIVKKHLNIVK